ncbi:MAG TPA: prepilin-type N-terminal cleavage/methylation domain-containing protein [Candidatus Saccharimonadales bacterium]
MHKNQAGFSVVEIIIVLVVIAVVGFIGYTVFNRQKSDGAKKSATQQVEVTDVSSAPQIKSGDDLDRAAKALDENDPTLSNGDVGQLDSELSAL